MKKKELEHMLYLLNFDSRFEILVEKDNTHLKKEPDPHEFRTKSPPYFLKSGKIKEINYNLDHQLEITTYLNFELVARTKQDKQEIALFFDEVDPSKHDLVLRIDYKNSRKPENIEINKKLDDALTQEFVDEFPELFEVYPSLLKKELQCNYLEFIENEESDFV